MTRFWKHKSEKPRVWNHYGWYYSVEYYGVTVTFIDIENLRSYRNDIAYPKRIQGVSISPSLWIKWGVLGMILYILQMRYIHFRHRKEILKLFDQAYEQFSAEQNNEEVNRQIENT